MTVEEYVDRLTSPEPYQLKLIERESNLRMAHGRMCSGHIQGRLLKMLVAMLRPVHVLELGTFTGYSALCIAEGLFEAGIEDARVVSVEANDEFEDFIRSNLDASPFGHLVDLHIGEALKFMKRLPDTGFDLVFIDADKRSYIDFFNEALRLLRPGGFVFADNTLWDGKVIDEGHHDPQTKGIIQFNEFVLSHPQCEQVILPLRDGFSIIRKRNTRVEC